MFNDKYGLTYAVLQGRKTMTRRLIKDGTPLGNWEETEKYAKYKIGEEVAVAQCYEDAILDVGEEKWNKIHKWYNINYLCHEKGLHNKMFVSADLMPHHIRITDIKVERLQDISDEDCLREGIYVHNALPNALGMDRYKFISFAYDATQDKHHKRWWFKTPKLAFAALIDKVSGKGTWKNNPWVFAYSFELLE